MGFPDWHTAMHSLRLQRLLVDLLSSARRSQWKERADRLASTADITSGLWLGRAEVLRGLRTFLNMDRPEHHSTDRLKERGVEKGSGRHSILRGRERGGGGGGGDDYDDDDEENPKDDVVFLSL